MIQTKLEKRAKFFVGTTVLLTLLLTGCGSKSAYVMPMENTTGYSNESRMEDSAYMDSKSAQVAKEASPEATKEEAAIAQDTGNVSQGNNGNVQKVSSNRKLIKNVSMDVETDTYDDLLPIIEANITELGGYIENLNAWNGSYNDEINGEYYGRGGSERNTSITARIPKDKLQEFVNIVGEQSNVTSRSESVEDVTLQYVDTESHKKMLLTEQKSLLKLLENAEKIEDIILIEGRLSEVRYQIESMESMLRTYDNLVDYSTVNLNIREVRVYTPQPEIGTLDKIKTGFAENIYYIKEDLKNAGIGFLINIPYYIIWGIVIVVLAFIIRIITRIIKKKRNKKGKKQETLIVQDITIKSENNVPKK